MSSKPDILNGQPVLEIQYPVMTVIPVNHRSEYVRHHYHK